MLKAGPFFFIVLLLCFSSCTKLLDYYDVGSDNYEPIPNCRIDRIYSGDPDDILDHVMEFNYSENGRLEGVSEQYPVTDPEGVFGDYWSFIYDERGRLITSGPWSTPRPFMNAFAYEGDSPLPVRDTSINMGGYTVEDFNYDTQGRIIYIKSRSFGWNEFEEFVLMDSLVTRYYYDIRGNRQDHPSNVGYNGLITYDDRPNLYSLSPVLKLLFRDWSKNSTLNATSYNEHGLPLKLAEQQPRMQPLMGMFAGETIEYHCE